tara:strand:+ start:551 stop:1027 length:477 start_codon:yes stop_codon:yes gene_type:complete
MKKLLLILLCLPLLFSTCKKEDEESPNYGSSNSACGNVTVTIDGVNRDYNPIETSCNSGGITEFNGSIIGISLAFNSFCTSMASDYMIVYSDINGSYITDNGCGSGSSSIFYLNATCDITNVNYSNSTISGDLIFPGASNKPNINISFSNVPATITSF